MQPLQFNWNNPYPTARTPIFARNAVSTSHPLAAQAGLQMLLKGGSAVDAIIATAAVLTIVEPVSNGLGSDAFAIVSDGTGLHGLNSSGISPAAWSPEYFKNKYGVDGNGIAKRPERGVDSITVPGAVKAWATLHERFGKLPFADLFEPAIALAHRGHTIAPMVAKKWAAAVPLLKDQPGFADTFMPHGRAPQTGEHFVMPAAARTFERIAQSHGRDYYEGEIAESLVSYLRQHGGAHTLDDFRAFEAEWVTPVSQDYAGYELHEIPPNGQGIAALIALGILKHHDVGAYPVDSLESQHVQIEAMKLAFADLHRYVSDPRSMEVTPDQMLDPGYLASRAKLIDMDKAGAFTFGRPPAGGTVYLTAADENGMMVSFIQSNYMGFGSGVVHPDWGISLQNRGFGFSMDPVSPNVVAGHKRPFHTIIPGFLTHQGVPRMSFGVMGGDMQPQGHMQTLIRMLTYGQNPQAACDAPRWKVNRDFTLDLESTIPAAIVDGLKAKGHILKSFNDPYMDFGAGQFIWRLSEDRDHGYVAASDSRRDGHAVGF
jgi:gamma-glutamyltranspeptidase/glutathione hydrolase